jgi:hypothetical protein
VKCAALVAVDLPCLALMAIGVFPGMHLIFR